MRSGYQARGRVGPDREGPHVTRSHPTENRAKGNYLLPYHPGPSRLGIVLTGQPVSGSWPIPLHTLDIPCWGIPPCTFSRDGL